MMGADEVKVIALITTTVTDAKMKVFFQKHPFDLTELDAVKMIDKKVNDALKSIERDNSDEHLTLLAKATEMLQDYFDELGINPASLL